LPATPARRILLPTNAEIPTVAAQTDALLRLYFNETYAEDAARAAVLDTSNRVAVFSFVLGNLPDRVKVYPT